ncbi:SRPBCC family protein [Tenacibaculum sp.]|uniref:SRPBCC family protein n=1 Tax=Tenacibaculum sp. TaxID=1906242 RepID=UPI003D139B5B
MLLILIGFLVVIVIITALSLWAPRRYELTRSIIIDRPYTGVFNYLKYLKNEDHWSPWKKKDVNIKQEFIGEDGSVGFIAKWQGNSEVGLGEQEITKIVENKIIETELRFYRPWKSISNAVTKVEDLGKMQTKVTWSFSGENKFPTNILMLFYNLDQTIGKDFEEGLANLKRLLEKS